MDESEIALVAWGARTPLGLNTPASVAAVRAGIAGFQEHPYMIDTAGKPMITAHASYVQAERSLDRFVELLVPALLETLSALERVKSVIHPMPLFVALPSERPGQTSVGDGLSHALKQLPALRSRFSSIECLTTGHAAGSEALQKALERVESEPSGLAMVAGVDSYIDPETLEWLEQSEQLHSAGMENNAWGFIPGEAAGCFLLATGKAREAHQLPGRGKILSVGLAQEANCIKTDSVCIGTGLTQAFRQALEKLPVSARVDHVICDQNGEPYRSDEYGFTIVRHTERFAAGSNFQSPSDCWGDVGAASIPLFIMLACVAAEKGYARGPHCLVWASSEKGGRGAVLLQLPRMLERR